MTRMTFVLLMLPAFALPAQVSPARPVPPVPPAAPVPPVPPVPFDAAWVSEEALRTAEAMRLDAEMRVLDLDLRATERAAEMAQRVLELKLGEQGELPIHLDAGSRFLRERPPAPWAQGDPADSLYRLAREALNRGEYRRAADLFAQISRRYPSSAYAPQSAYWEAFSRYRLGTTEELRSAVRALDALAARSTPLSRETDVAGLRARIDGALAMRGDPDAVTRVRQLARDGDGERGAACDREEVAVRVEALNALARMDPDGATPTIRRVLSKKDDCSRELRRRAVFVLARRADATSAAMLADVARGDPSLDVRAEAIQYLMRMPGDAGLSTVEEILRESGEERIQRAAASALMSSDSPRARQSARALLERRDANERLQIDVLGRFGHERSTPDDAAFLRAYYTRTGSERLRMATINALARIGGKENEDFLMAIVRNQEEPSSLRASALSRLGRMGSITVADLARLYDVADTRAMREQLISALANRKEDEATEKLIDIARNSTDSHARRLVINALTRRNDPRAAAALKELIEK